MIRTWMPEPDYLDSAACLHPRHLAAQRAMCVQMLDHRRLSPRLARSPGLRLWEGRRESLGVYALVVCHVWTLRNGHRDSVAGKVLDSIRPEGARDRVEQAAALNLRHPTEAACDAAGITLPDWFGDPEIHAQHRLDLLRARPEHYTGLWHSGCTALDRSGTVPENEQSGKPKGACNG